MPSQAIPEIGKPGGSVVLDASSSRAGPEARLPVIEQADEEIAHGPAIEDTGPQPTSLVHPAWAEALQDGYQPAEVGVGSPACTDVRGPWTWVARLAAGCVICASIGIAAFMLSRGAAGPTDAASQFLQAFESRDQGALAAASFMDSGFRDKLPALVNGLPSFTSHRMGSVTDLGTRVRVEVELVGAWAGRPITGAGRQRVSVTLVVFPRKEGWRVDAARFFRDTYAGISGDGIEQFYAIAGTTPADSAGTPDNE